MQCPKMILLVQCTWFVDLIFCLFFLFHILNAVIELVRAWCNLFFLSTLPAAHSTVSNSLKGMVFTSLNKGKGNYLLMVRFSKCLN